MSSAGLSWGRYPLPENQTVVPLHWRDASLPELDGRLLAYGNGRSYGDSCTNAGGFLLHTRGLDRFIAFDPASGMLRCEAGVLFSEILDLAVPRGWFLPVTPGTKFITVGGAIANDVHGKNHHRAGTFGEHVQRFELLRSDGARLLCSRSENADLFRATIGGLGLTGVITWAEFALRRVANPWMTVENRRFADITGFLTLSAESERHYDYTVAWVDCAGGPRARGRGWFMRANHAPADITKGPQAPRRRLSVPFTPPLSLINRASLRAFNAVYFHRRLPERRIEHYDPYFYPLDAIGNWNRIYGPRGFLQYQCVVPMAATAAIPELLAHVARAGSGSFLAVLKVFGDRPAAGILSFARAGTTLALDFPHHGQATLDLLERLDDIVVAAGGAVYPAKDGRLRHSRFVRYFPDWQAMLPHIDPRFSSGWWRRVMES